ncbi:hypothetical protein RRG08_013685 [Elysia crispata]|uniref:PiggyBac transposable element-derived protein domain-containing protein n=1 Tax=Elysia crispata TaxID=231223 RepID=A0AAE1DRL4_9GAST|nr:hypothetical protein RRG08_013685 [Elysia crispata]
MLENLNNYSDSDCLLSDDDDPPYAGSRSSSNSSSNGSETDHDYAGLNLSIAIAERCPQHRVKDKATTLTSTQNQPKQSVFEKPLRPLDKRHHIFTDRFYTSMPLLKYLKTRRFYYTDTVDVCRKDFPPEIKTLKLDFFQIK